MIDDPLPGSTDSDSVPVQLAVLHDPVEGVRREELMADLVRHVVDGERVADRRIDSRAAPRLHCLAHAEQGDAPAVAAEHEVSDVEVGGTREQTDGDLSVAKHRDRAGRLGEAGGSSAWPVGAAVLGGRREVQLVRVVDQDELDREVVVVELVDAVDQRHLGRQNGRVAAGTAAAYVGSLASARR